MSVFMSTFFSIKQACLVVLSVISFSFSNMSLASGGHNHHHGMHSPVVQTDNSFLVYKSATCGCCKKWVSHLKSQGLAASSQDREDMSAIKDKFGIGKQYRSCHTGVTKDGYVFEGHIPAKFIAQFLQERPNQAIGLSVPGMPVGSPGMVVSNKFMAYEVLQLNKDGSTQVYAKIKNTQSQF